MAPKKPTNPLAGRFGAGVQSTFSIKPAIRSKYGGEPPKPKNPVAARYSGSGTSSFSIKPAIRSKYGPPSPPTSGMDIIRSSAGSSAVRPRLPQSGPSRPRTSIFGREFERTSPIGSATAMQRKSEASLGSTLGKIKSGIKSGITTLDSDIRSVTSTLDADLRSTVMKPRDPVRPNRPRRSPTVRVEPTAAGPQAVNPSNRPNIGRAADQYRRNARPAQFGTVGESLMNKPGMLNIPRAGKKLEKVVAGSDLPTPPGMKPDKPKKVKIVKAEPKPEKVSLPKPPKKVTPPKPKPTIDPAKTPDQTFERAAGQPTGSGGKGPSPKPSATYRPLTPPAPKTDPTPRAPQSPGPTRVPQPSQRPAPTVRPKKRPTPKVVGERGPVKIIHEGGRNYTVKHEAGPRFPIPYNPNKKGRVTKKAIEGTLDVISKPRSNTQAREVKLTPSEIRSARSLGISERAALKDKQQLVNMRAAKNAADPALGFVTRGEKGKGRGWRQVRVGKSMGLLGMGLGAVGMVPDIVRLGRGASLGSLVGPAPTPSDFSGASNPNLVYTIRDKKTRKTYKMGGGWS